MAGELIERARPRLSWETIFGGGALFEEDGFRRLWIGRALTHTALNAVLFSLLVLAVGNGSGSSIKSALFITAYILPTATLGTISGVIVDRLPKNMVLTAVNVCRMGLMILLLMSDGGLWTIYGIALLLAVASQFGTPAEVSALPHVVRPGQLTKATSVNNMAGLLGQVLGFAVLVPLFMNTVGARPLFFIAAVLFGGGAAFFLSIRDLGGREIDIETTLRSVREVRKQFALAWDTLSRDFRSYMSVITVVLASTASLIGVALMPQYTQRVLDIKVSLAIFVFLPAALGILAGLRLVEVLERRVAKHWLVSAGFALFLASLLGLALTRPMAEIGQGLVGDGTAARIITAMVFSTAGAFSFAVAGVASRSLVHERMPLELQGRIFAAQHVLTNLASIPPILLVGVLAELFGVEAVVVLCVLILAGTAVWTAARAAARPVPISDVAAG